MDFSFGCGFALLIWVCDLLLVFGFPFGGLIALGLIVCFSFWIDVLGISGGLLLCGCNILFVVVT